MVTKPPQRHRLLRERSEKSNKDGFWSKEIELRAKPEEIEFDNFGKKAEAWGSNRNVQILNAEGKCGLQKILSEERKSSQATRS